MSTRDLRPTHCPFCPEFVNFHDYRRKWPRPLRGSGRKKIVKSEKESAVGWLRDTRLQVKPGPNPFRARSGLHDNRHVSGTDCHDCHSLISPSTTPATASSWWRNRPWLRPSACGSGDAERPSGQQHNLQMVGSSRLMARTDRSIQVYRRLYRSQRTEK